MESLLVLALVVAFAIYLDNRNTGPSCMRDCNQGRNCDNKCGNKRD